MPIYKDQKRNTWYFRVYIEDYKGNRKQITRSGFPTKTIAKNEEKKLIASYDENYIDIKFNEIYEVFIKDKAQQLKPQSFRAIESRFRNHILPYFGGFKINKITHKVYIDWKEQILKKNLSYKYNSSLHTCMVTFLNYAMDFYNLEKNIASKVGNFKKNNYQKKVDFWTYEEFNKFVSVIKDKIYYTYFNTLYFTGMRQGECLALTWNDFKEDYLDITKSLVKGKDINNNYIITSPKTISSIRKIKLDSHIIKLLKELKDHYKGFIGFNEEWFIFGGLNALSQTTIGRKKNEYCKLANVKQIKIHDFRHSHATILLSKGVPVTVISKRLGHSDIKMTLNTYSHLIPEDEDKAIVLIENLNQKNSFAREKQENEILKNEKTPENRELVN